MFTKADFERNEDNNYHTENGVEIAKHFGTKEEQELMAKIAKDHYDRGYINPEEIEARNGIVNKYFHMLEQAQPIKEDETDNEKKSAIYNLRMSLQSLKDEVNELADLDNKPNASGRGDLHDQLATMDKLTSSFEAVLGRAYDIVPGDDVIESKKQIDEGYEGAIIHALQQHDINGFFNKGTLYIEDGADMNTVEEIVNQTVEIAPEIKPEDDYYQMEGIEKSEALTEEQFDEAAGEKDACYHKVKSRYKVWPSAYASGALVKCRKVGASNWGNSKKK